MIVDQQASSTRYHLLETIREYARERLQENGEAEKLRQRHADFMLALAENVPLVMTSAERKARYVCFDIEQDNYRAAMGWALLTHHAELGLQLVGQLGEYWFWWANRWDEGWLWISQFLELPESIQPKRARAHALRASVNLLHWQAQYTEANRLADESLALYRELDDKSGMAWVMVDKGRNLLSLQEENEAVSFMTEGLVLFREIGDPRGIGWALGLLSIPEELQGQTSKAAALLEASIAALQSGGDDAMLRQNYASLGLLTYNSGDYTRTAELLSQAMELCRMGGDAVGEQSALVLLAINSLVQGDIERAASQLEASVAWHRKPQNRHGLAEMLHWAGYVRHLQGDDNAARAALREALELQQEQQRDGDPIESLEVCAWMSADLHQPQRAARLLGATEAARERIEWPFPPGDKPLYDRHLARATADLEEVAFDTAWAQGRALTLEQAIEYALELPLEPEVGVPQAKPPQAPKKELHGLTARERQVAARTAQGESNREIAEALVVSERTVESHVTNILNKLGFTTRAQIRKWAVKNAISRIDA